MSDFIHAMPRASAVTPRGRLNLVMGLLVAGASAFGFWRWREQAEDAAAVSAQIAAHAAQGRIDEQQNRVGTAREERGLPLRAPQASATPLPPWGEPLGANFEVLRRRADAGDARAACRVGVELSLCNLGQPGDRSIATAQPRALDAGASPARADAAADAGGQQGLDRYCQGVDRALRNQAASYLRKAALAGNRDAMLRYAQGPFFNGSGATPDPYRYLQDPAFADWYREAVPMLQRALRAGDPLAAQLLANAHADDHGPLQALVPDDPAQAYRYRLLLSYLRGEPAADPGTLDLRQRADAEHQAQRLYRESFGSRPVSGGVPHELGLQPDDPLAAPCQ